MNGRVGDAIKQAWGGGGSRTLLLAAGFAEDICWLCDVVHTGCAISFTVIVRCRSRLPARAARTIVPPASKPFGRHADRRRSASFGELAAGAAQLGLPKGVTLKAHGQCYFHDYAPLRIDECPAIEVEIISSDRHPGGVGEPGTPPIAPAVANAVYALTGQRLRSLPLQVA
jgi:hypothetical protein